MRKVILVQSLKGGVGKTLASANITYRLAKSQDKGVIAIDGDLDSPNLPRMFKIEQEMDVTIEGFTPAHFGDNIDLFSMALVAKDRAISMTGAGYIQILRDAIKYTQWSVNIRDCYIIVDCPAGAGDIFKELVAYFNKDIVGTILVTIPRESDDLRRVIKLNKHFGIPILGVIENMSRHICEQCEEVTYPFGQPKTEQICKDNRVPFIGSIPLARSIQEKIDEGYPVLPSDYDEPITEAVATIIEAEPVGDSFLQRFRKKVSSAMQAKLVKLLGKAIVKANMNLDIDRLQRHGFGGNIIELVILDDQNNVITEMYMTLKKGKLMLKKDPERRDIIIEVPLEVLKKTSTGQIDLDTAYFAGDVRVYGTKAALRVLLFFKKVWGTIKDDAERELGFIGDEAEED